MARKNHSIEVQIVAYICDKSIIRYYINLILEIIVTKYGYTS